MIVAGLYLALLATSAQADVWTFETPSQNIQCTVGQEAGVQSDITCTIIERSGSYALPRPSDCSSDWGHTFSMREYGSVEGYCGPTNRSRNGFSKAEYGVTGEFGGFTCDSSKRGLKCTNRDGNGFFLSRKVQSVLYGAGEQGSSNGLAAASSSRDGVSVPQVMNMPYGKARSVLREHGWWPLDNAEPGNLVSFTREIYDQGYIEVSTCSPVGDTPCKFYFYNDHGQYLEVSTRGENPLVAGTEIMDVRAVEARTAASAPETGAYNEPANISVACNRNGAVISLPDRSKVYLGNQCDAYKPGAGHGGWWLAASAFLVEINGQTTRYANDLSCDTLSYCQYRDALAQMDQASPKAAGAVAQPHVNGGSVWSSTPGQGFHTAGIANGAGDSLTVTCGTGAPGTPGSSIALQIGGSPIKTGTLVELWFEGTYPGVVPLLLSRENAFVVGDPSVSPQHFETAVETLKSGRSVSVRVRRGPEAQFSLDGSSAAIGECKAVSALETLSAAAGTSPVSGQKIAQEKVAERPVTVDANAGLVRSEIARGYQFVTLDGYAVLPERQLERIAGTIQPWITWTNLNFPIALPQLIEPDLPGGNADDDDIYAIALAHSFLSDAEKAAIEDKLGLPFPLFSDFEGISANSLRNMGYEGVAVSYANQLIHARDRLDEFTRGPALQEIRSVLRAKIAASKPQLPLPVARIYEVSLGEYDFENGGFPVEGTQRFLDPAATRISGIVGSARFNTDVMEYPKFIPMEPEAAKRLIEGIAEYRGDRHRVANMAVFGDVTGIGRKLQKGGLYTFELAHKVKRIDFGFGDKVLGDVFYSMVPDKLEDAEIDAVRDDGRTTPATLYGPEYLVSAVSDAFPDFLNAQGILETLMQARITIENADLASWGLENLPTGKILRAELAEPRTKPNEDDIRLFRAFLDGRRQAGIGNEIVLPVSTWVRQTDGGKKTIEHARPVDLIAHALDQNMALFGRLRGTRDPRGALKRSPYANEPGRILLSAGNLNVERRNWTPVLFSLKLDKANPNALLSLKNDLNEPATTHGGETQLADPRIDGELRGHLVLELEEAPIIVEEHEASESGKLVMFKVALKRVTFIDQGRELNFDFDNRPDSGNGDSELPVVPTPESLLLDAETSDLLILRHLPETVSDADFKRMLLARWEVENRNRDINSQLPWGRFFEIGQPKPEGRALDAVLPKFRDWSKARAANLPETLQIEPRGLPINQPGLMGFGNTLANPNALQTGLMSCETAVRVSKGQTNYPQHKLAMLENACEYIRQAITIPSDVAYVGDSQSLIAVQRAARTASSSFSSPGRHGTVGRRAECNRDDYCRAVQEAIKAGVFGETVFTLDDVYVFDKAADIRPELIAQVHRKNIQVRLNARVAGIERSTQARPSPLARALMKVDEFIASEELLEHHTMDDWVPEIVETNFFDIRLVSMDLVERKTGVIMASVPLVDIPENPDAALLQPVERQAVAPPSEAYGRDIAGLRLGMSFEEADKIIRSHMEVGRTLTADRSWSVRAAAGTIDPFSSGVAYESKDGREIIIIHDEPPSAAKVVIGAVRQVVFEKGKVSPEQVFSQAREKYGQANLAENNSQAWVDDDEADVNCMAFSAAQQRRDIWRNADGSSEPWAPGTFRGGGAPAPMQTERSGLDYRSKCGPGVTVTFETRENRDWDRLIFRLHDAKTLFKHITQSEAMVREGASFAGETATEGETTGIKF